MMKVTTLVILFSLSLLYSCKYYSHEKTDNIVSQKRTNIIGLTLFFIDLNKTDIKKSKNLDFYYHDSLGYGHPFLVTDVATKLLIKGPTMIFEANCHQIPFLILPGEKLNIRYSESDSIQLYIRGNLQRTNELNFFRKLVQETGNIYYAFKGTPYTMKVNSIEKLQISEKIINEIKCKRLHLLNIYRNHYSISNSFFKIALSTIRSSALSDSLLLFYHSQFILKKKYLFNKLIIEKLETIKNIEFIPCQIYYYTSEILVSLSISENISIGNINNNNDFVKRFAFIENNFDGMLKDFLLANTIYIAYSNGVQIPAHNMLKFSTLPLSNNYKILLDRKLNKINTVSFPIGNNKVLLTDGKSVCDIKSVISKYKSKLIIIDFWASWCAPCRAEMPYSAKLKNIYKNKAIVFVCLSTDSNIDDWITANKEESLGKEDSYLVLNSQTSTFLKHYNVNTIPRYMIINKEGKIINEDAPRPSDAKLKKLIDKYL